MMTLLQVHCSRVVVHHFKGFFFMSLQDGLGSKCLLVVMEVGAGGEKSVDV